MLAKYIPFQLTARRLGLIITFVVLALYMVGNRLLDVIELKTYDMRLLAAGTQTPQGDVAIAAIDEQSLAAHGRWPWSRRTMARIVKKLDEAGARVIAFDVFFSESENRDILDQINRLEREDGFIPRSTALDALKRALSADNTFEQAIRQSGHVVLPYVFLFGRDEARFQSKSDAERALANIQNTAFSVIRATGDGRTDFPMVEPAGLVTNLPELATAAQAGGHINSIPDGDGSVRWAPLVIRHQGLFFPSADLQAARLYLNQPFALRVSDYGIKGVELGTRLIPTDEYGRALIRYHGPVGTIPTYSMKDLLAGKLPDGALRGRVVLIGATAQGLGDIRVTPFGSAYPGVEIRANTIQNLISDQFIQRPGWMLLVDLMALAALGFLLAWWLPRLGMRTGIAITGGLLLAWFGAALALFHTAQVWVSLVYPTLLILALFVTNALYHYFTTESEKRQIKNAFQHYVPAAIVDRITSDIGALALGGEKRELSVLFSDIRGFTSIAETLAPEELVNLLNVYLTQMTDKVFAHDGLLDKYIGDAIMAVYGAPIPHPDHARRACHTAIDMLRELDRLRADWHARGLPQMDIGIGINTGPMVVGNMGSKNRFDYTVIGDAVNLASRIEGLNKNYGTHILITESTWQAVKDEFPHTREIDVVQVRGRQEQTRLYEIMLPEHYPHMDWLPEFARGLELFRADLRVQARTVFDTLVRETGDPVSRYYLDRCGVPRRRRSD